MDDQLQGAGESPGERQLHSAKCYHPNVHCASPPSVALKLVSGACLPPLSRQLKSTREIVSLLWWMFPTASLCGKGEVGVLKIRKEGVRREPPFENPNLIFPGPMPVSMETAAGSRNGNQNPEMQTLALLLISLAGFQLPFPQGNGLQREENIGRLSLWDHNGCSHRMGQGPELAFQARTGPHFCCFKPCFWKRSQKSSRQLGPRPRLGRIQLLASCWGMQVLGSKTSYGFGPILGQAVAGLRVNELTRSSLHCLQFHSHTYHGAAGDHRSRDLSQPVGLLLSGQPFFRRLRNNATLVGFFVFWALFLVWLMMI